LLRVIEGHLLVKRVGVRRIEAGSARGYVRVEAVLLDGSELHVFEYVDSGLRRTSYAYHLQDRFGGLVFRYDNEPHYPELAGFPHHKHVADGSSPVASVEVRLDDALAEASEYLTGRPREAS
jgi:hypothetical protein